MLDVAHRGGEGVFREVVVVSVGDDDFANGKESRASKAWQVVNGSGRVVVCGERRSSSVDTVVVRRWET